MDAPVLYNTRTRGKERLVPLEAGHVRMYSCGPTVYAPQHIGNLRSQLLPDVLKRLLQVQGLRVTHVVNVTDVFVNAPPVASAFIAPLNADLAHPAFSNLFVQTEILTGHHAILCRRRPRETNEQTPWMFHLLAMPGGVAGVDFVAESSTSQFIYGVGDSPYLFESTPRLAADVQLAYRLKFPTLDWMEPLVGVRLVWNAADGPGAGDGSQRGPDDDFVDANRGAHQRRGRSRYERGPPIHCPNCPGRGSGDICHL